MISNNINLVNNYVYVFTCLNSFRVYAVNDMVFLTTCLQFSTSALCLAKKAKADRIVVLCSSVASGHKRQKARQRLGDKLEFLDWDPLIEQEVLYREDKKIKSIRDNNITRITRLRISNNIHNKWPSLARDPSSA